MMSTKDLFALLTRNEDWYIGYCSLEYARVLKSRHKLGTLGVEGYWKLFNHFGYLPYWNKK